MPVSLDCPFLISHSVFSNVYLTLPLFIKVYVPSQESERSCICVLGALILPLLTIFYWTFELFRQCVLFWFSFYLSQQNVCSNVRSYNDKSVC